MFLKNLTFAFTILLISGTFGCKSTKTNKTANMDSKPAKLEMPEWAKNANIYEVNIRQFSKEGTFNAFTAQLPRIKAMGSDILWLMPIFPVSEVKRKGSWGSHYAVADYTATNPRYGSLDDFKALVKKAHSLGMKVILDWVPNHTGWDNKWITAHPEWYTHLNDTITHPIDPSTGKPTDWYDVADLNYDNKEMRKAMTEALKWWVKETDIDGYRMDVAGFVPDDFWYELRPELHKVKQLFMLAEWEKPELFEHNAFDMCYGWGFHHLCKQIYKGEKNANDIDLFLADERARYKEGYFKMLFTNNHDENSWNGTERELFGDAMNTFFVLCATLDGMPLIYNGQEAGLDHRLAFFEKDEIDWKDLSRADFFKTMLKLKHDHAALGNGKYGAPAQRIKSSDDLHIYAFSRTKGDDRVVVVLNLTAKTIPVTLNFGALAGTYSSPFSNEKTTMNADTKMTLEPWEFKIFFQ